MMKALLTVAAFMVVTACDNGSNVNRKIDLDYKGIGGNVKLKTDTTKTVPGAGQPEETKS